jgi:hypothetical protein
MDGVDSLPHSGNVLLYSASRVVLKSIFSTLDSWVRRFTGFAPAGKIHKWNRCDFVLPVVQKCLWLKGAPTKLQNWLRSMETVSANRRSEEY